MEIKKQMPIRACSRHPRWWLLSLGLAFALQADPLPLDQGVTPMASPPPRQGDGQDPQAQIQRWSYAAQDIRLPAEARAEALRQLAAYPSQGSLVAVARGLTDDNPLVREAAASGAEPYRFEHRWRLVSPLLTDRQGAVRLAATRSLLRDYGAMDAQQKTAIALPAQELIQTLEEQGASELLADAYRWTQQWDKAQSRYEALLGAQPDNARLWLGLADNFRVQQQDKQALATLSKGLERLPENANLLYSKALTLVRLGQKDGAAISMQQAAELGGDNSYFWYLNGVLQEKRDLEQAIASFERAYLISGAPEQLYAVCDIYLRYQHPKTDACLAELGKIVPPDVIGGLATQRRQ